MVRRACHLLIVLAIVACAAGAPTASAAARVPHVPVALSEQAVGSDHALFVSLAVRSSLHTTCTAAVRIGDRSVSLPGLRTGDVGSGRWSWESGPGAGSGRWRFRVVCRRGRARTTRVLVATVRNRAVRGRGLNERRPLMLAGSAHAVAAVIEKGGGLGKGSSGGNPYAFPQCTWYAWSRRQDLPVFHANALDWGKAARAAGVPVGSEPVAGAIVVFQPGQYGAGRPYGHVAYVESVSGSQIRISEMNWGLTYAEESRVHYRTIPWAGLQFILPRSSQPAPAPTPPSPPAGSYPHHVYHTCADGACGLRLHTSPSVNAPVLGTRNDGDEVDLVCQTTGDVVTGLDGSGSNVWDKLADGSYASDFYIDTSGTNGAFSPPIPRCSSSPPSTPTPAPTPPQTVVHYDCPNAPNAFGHYVPAGKHWGNDFIAQGHAIVGGSLLIGANADGNDHRATIGVYTGGPYTLSGLLGSVTVPVSGYGGVSFTFPTPISVTPGESLWLVASGVGDFTAYDQNNGGADGCFIGRLNGTA